MRLSLCANDLLVIRGYSSMRLYQISAAGIQLLLMRSEQPSDVEAELWTNPGETVLTPFMGVGSEVFGAVVNGRRGIGIELKQTYYRQAVKNLNDAKKRDSQNELFGD